MTTEKQSSGLPAGLENQNYAGLNDASRKAYDAYFDQRWPLVTGRNLLAAAGTGAGLMGLYHLVRHFTAEKQPQAHQNFYAGPKTFPENKKQKDEKVAADAPLLSQPSVMADQRPMTAGAWTGANIAGVPLALLGGGYLMNKLVRMNKRKNYDAEIAAARQEYERALGEKISSLHAAYDKYQEKRANNNAGAGVASWLTGTLPYLPGVNQALKGYNAYAIGAGGLSAALAGKLVYDLTRQRSNSEALRRAQDARARLSSLPPLWVTPDDVTTATPDAAEEAPKRKAASV